MFNLFNPFKKQPNQPMEITKELIGIQFPVNATSFAKVASTRIIGEKLDLLFSDKDPVVVFPSSLRRFDDEKIAERTVGRCYTFCKLFKGKCHDVHHELSFDENSLCIHFTENVSFEFVKQFSKAVSQAMDAGAVLIRDGGRLYLCTPALPTPQIRCEKIEGMYVDEKYQSIHDSSF